MSESNTITPDEYLDIAGELAAAQREIEKATGRKRAILKRFKDKGGDNDALSLVQKLSRRDTGDRIQLLSNVKKYASWAAITLWEPGGQMAWSLDDNTPQPSGAAVERLNAARAYEAGHASGKAGGDPQGNPFNAGSETFVQWENGYKDGQTYIAEQMGKNARRAAASEDADVGGAEDAGVTRKRGRPPGSPNKPKVGGKPKGAGASALN